MSAARAAAIAVSLTSGFGAGGGDRAAARAPEETAGDPGPSPLKTRKSRRSALPPVGSRFAAALLVVRWISHVRRVCWSGRGVRCSVLLPAHSSQLTAHSSQLTAHSSQRLPSVFVACGNLCRRAL
eukprot:2435567-Rhodomonas_salina.1